LRAKKLHKLLCGFQAGAEYENRPLAPHLRAMNMLYEAIKEKGSMVIFPSSAVEMMGLGGCRD